jgi:hypothetical protein
MNKILDKEALLQEIRTRDPSVLMIEGSRLSGKTTLARSLPSCMLPQHWMYYTTLKNRKDHKPLRDLVDGAHLDLGQATFYILDLVQQNPDIRLVCDRSPLSPFVFTKLRDLYGEQSWIIREGNLSIDYIRSVIFKRILLEMKGLLIYVEPTMDEIKERSIVHHRESELRSIEDERLFYRQVLGNYEQSCVVYSGDCR